MFCFTNYPENRRMIRIMPSVHNTTTVINYCADNSELNSFLQAYDVWGSSGCFKPSEYPCDNHQEVWFEMSKEFYELSKTVTMQRAFKHFGVRVMYYNDEKSHWELLW